MIMGGAYKSHGNCTPVAEFNVWFDPHAAAEVFENLGRPITMTGLDVTRQVVMTPNLLQMIRRLRQSAGNDDSRYDAVLSGFSLEGGEDAGMRRQRSKGNSRVYQTGACPG